MYSKNDYRYYLEHRLAQSDDFLMHYGVKGMKWKNHIYARKFANTEEPDSMVYEAGNKNHEVYGVTFKDKRNGNSINIGHINKKKQEQFDPTKTKYKSEKKRISKRITKFKDNTGRTNYSIDLGTKKQRLRNKGYGLSSTTAWGIRPVAYRVKDKKR